MAIEITIPRLGWSMDEGTFGEWLKSDGDHVEAGEAIFTLESDKALQEVESVDDGYLNLLPGGPVEGDTVTVGTLVAWLLEDGESVPAAPEALTTTAAHAGHDAIVETPDSVAVVSRERSGRGPAISPRAARLARECGVDWPQIEGSGRTGRIRECDVRAVVDTRNTASATEAVGLSATRRVIAERMMSSVRNAAPVTLTARVDATHLVALREQYKSRGKQVIPAVHDLVAKLCAVVLADFPDVTAQWTDDGLIDPGGIHIGLAVDTDAGLVVPVIRDADQLSLIETANRTRDLITRAQSRTCTVDELSGGTFSITNLGQYGIEFFTPILNPPQSAILGLGAIRREAVVLDDDSIVGRLQIPLSLTFDHRVVDGAPAARFLQALGRAIENPAPLLIQ